MSDQPQRVIGRPFEKGNPGRPKGSRSKLAEKFLQVLLNDFNEHGVEAVEACRITKPDVYVKTIGSILPKEITGENGEALITNITVKFVKPDGGS